MPESAAAKRSTAKWHARSGRLGRTNFAVDAATLAQRLLGCVLVRVLDGERLAARIVETEAYVGVQDLASHARGGRRTARNEPMYGPPGLAYVYFTYGMHHCMNVVCGEEGEPVAVLLRAAEPLEGLRTMRRLRGGTAAKPVPDTALCSGPGKLCQAMGINRLLSGVDLTTDSRMFLECGRPSLATRVNKGGRGKQHGVVNTARIGVDYADDWAAAPLRWVVADSPHASVRPPGGRRRRNEARK